MDGGQTCRGSIKPPGRVLAEVSVRGLKGSRLAQQLGRTGVFLSFPARNYLLRRIEGRR